MTPELTDIARRAIACPRCRWITGHANKIDPETTP